MTNQITPNNRRKELALKLGISAPYLYQCLTGRRDMGPIEARRIEAESHGELTRQMVCQKTWRLIWPELDLAPVRSEPVSVFPTHHQNRQRAVGNVLPIS